MSSKKAPKGSKKLLHAWAFFDWSTSVYSLVIASAIFPIYLGELFRVSGTDTVELWGRAFERAPLISYVSSIAFVVIALVTPLVSGIADYTGNKKVFFIFFSYLGALSCIGLYFFSLEWLEISLLIYLLALVGFWVNFAIYNSYLPDIAFPDQHDRISAKGYSLGYIGSVLLLLVNLVMVMFPDSFGITDAADGTPAKIMAMKYSFAAVGVWWIAFSQYTFRYMPRGNQRSGQQSSILLGGFRELGKVWSELRSQLRLKSYLASFFVYSIAVQTIMLIAAYFGEEEVGWGSGEERTLGLIVSILLIQLIAIPGSLLTSRSSERFGNIPTLIGVNLIWVGLCVYAYFVYEPVEFYIAAGGVGLVMGGIQTLSRSTYSKFLPPESPDTTSYFSFYDVAEKIGIIIGTFLYAMVAEITGSMRNSAIFLGLFFLMGAVMLSRVPRKPQPLAARSGIKNREP